MYYKNLLTTDAYLKILFMWCHSI